MLIEYLIEKEWHKPGLFTSKRKMGGGEKDKRKWWQSRTPGYFSLICRFWVTPFSLAVQFTAGSSSPLSAPHLPQHVEVHPLHSSLLCLCPPQGPCALPSFQIASPCAGATPLRPPTPLFQAPASCFRSFPDLSNKRTQLFNKWNFESLGWGRHCLDVEETGDGADKNPCLCGKRQAKQ